jgi:hypothetical protein
VVRRVPLLRTTKLDSDLALVFLLFFFGFFSSPSFSFFCFVPPSPFLVRLCLAALSAPELLSFVLVLGARFLCVVLVLEEAICAVVVVSVAVVVRGGWLMLGWLEALWVWFSFSLMACFISPSLESLRLSPVTAEFRFRSQIWCYGSVLVVVFLPTCCGEATLRGGCLDVFSRNLGGGGGGAWCLFREGGGGVLCPGGGEVME